MRSKFRGIARVGDFGASDQILRRFAPQDDNPEPRRGREPGRFVPGRDQVRIRFTPAMAYWARERYPDHEAGPDGSVTVTFPASGVDWIVRAVLEYGVDAEVVGRRGISPAA